ncbi:Glycine-rich domain-containing protein 1, partial [Lasiodiplodia hormozganensis]
MSLPNKLKKSPRDSFVSSHSRNSSSAAAPPPAYGEQQTDGPSNEAPALPPDFTSRLQSLNIDPLRRQAVPAADECIVHLKLLEAFYNLRQDIETTEGIFGIASPTPATAAPQYEKKALDQDAKAEDGAVDEELKHKIKQVREKRWAVYVSRAVERYEQWFLERIPKLTGGEMVGPMYSTKLLADSTLHETAGSLGERLRNFFPENLPPLDVLMVWHAHTLNPRIFFEDCLRYGCLDFWATGLPWADINTCIDNTTFDYDVGEPVKAMWRRSAQLSWDNLDDPIDKDLRCPFCTQATFFFAETCPNCKCTITHDTLEVWQFRQDISRLMREDVPMCGTILDNMGRPPYRGKKSFNPPTFFASGWIKQSPIHIKLLEATDLKRDASASLDSVRIVFEEGLSQRNLTSTWSSGPGGRPTPRELVSVRRMMSRYWKNHSVFGINLIGAVIRQGTFIEKMHNIGWLFSPTVYSTSERLLKKYKNFFRIMAAHPKKMAVPTLDVDLAWHTHQTLPSNYYNFCQTICNGVFIDHDDKVEEAKLDESFEWTSKTYQRMFGEPYSECTCWYCEAIRESHTSPLSRLFKTTNHSASASLHEADGVDHPSDPHSGPHISSHSSVRTNNSYAWSAARRSHLERAFASAVRRAKKEGREPPVREEYYAAQANTHLDVGDKKKKNKDDRNSSNAYYYGAACAPFIGYAYGPYPLGGVGYVGGSDPGFAETGSGMSGGCCQGTCGGMIGAGGGCAGVGGTCGGGGCGGA